MGANLENNTGYGSGYRFGYFDEDLRFEELGETDEKETQITVLKAQNTWFYYDRSSGKYIYSNSDNGGTVVGCFHLLIDSFRRFDDAAEEAEEYDGRLRGLDRRGISGPGGSLPLQGGRPGRRR